MEKTLSYSEIDFVGRYNEIALFKSLLEGNIDGKWILLFTGPGGIGKTQLLFRFNRVAQESKFKVLVTNQLIDLFWSENQQEMSLLKNILQQLMTEIPGDLKQAFDRLDGVLTIPDIDPSLVQEYLHQVRDRFIHAYQELDAERIVLLFDTAELATETVLDFWAGTLPMMFNANPGTRVVIAGRDNNLHKILEHLPHEKYEHSNLTGLTDKEVSLYLEYSKVIVDETTRQKLMELSEGRPILIALVLDWLKDGHAIQQLLSYEKEQFEASMVKRVAALRFPEDYIILCMAYLSRRFNGEILARVLNLPQTEAQNKLLELSRFSFVKYFQPVKPEDGNGVCLLHDEMRDLINNYVWPSVDMSGGFRRGWGEQILLYYQEKIENSSDRIERWTLGQERLYYWLDIDIHSAFAHYKKLFSEAVACFATDYMDALNGELERMRTNLDLGQQSEFMYRIAMVLQQRDRSIDNAISILESLLNTPDAPIDVQADVRPQLATCYLKTGHPEWVLENASNALNDGGPLYCWFESMLESPNMPEGLRKKLCEEYGRLCNVVGLACRAQDRLIKTETFYKKALDLYNQAGGLKIETANTLNNLGYVYHRLGRNDEALATCDLALEIRKRLNRLDQLGYSYNVLGMIRVERMQLKEAERNFQLAIEAFDAVGSDRGQAMVLVAYARLKRQSRWYEERLQKEIHDPECEEYVQANHFLERAVPIFEDRKDNLNLMEAWNEWGTLRRQQKYWDDAVVFFERSLALAKLLRNDYKESDNLIDLGILFEYKGDLEQALKYSLAASSRTWDQKSYYLFAKAQRVVASVYFRMENFPPAFDAAENACAYIVRLDPEPTRLGDIPAKREQEYESMLHWLKGEIINLPSHDLVHDAVQKFTKRWTVPEEGAGGKCLADEYRGFIPALEGVDRNYDFLKMGSSQ